MSSIEEQISKLAGEVSRLEAEQGPDHPDLIPVLTALGLAYKDAGDMYTFPAMETLERVLNIHRTGLQLDLDKGITDWSLIEELGNKENNSNDDNPILKAFLEYSEALCNLADLFRSQGNTQRALPYFNEALEIVEKTLGAYHPCCCAPLEGITAIYIDQGKEKKAEQLAKRLLEIREDTGQTQTGAYAIACGRMAGVHAGCGETNEAAAYFEKALTVIEKIKEDKKPQKSDPTTTDTEKEQQQQQPQQQLSQDLVEILQAGADFYDKNKNLKTATAVYERCLAVQNSGGGGSTVEDKLRTLQQLSELYQKQENEAEAVKAMEQWVQAAEDAGAVNDLEYAKVLEKLAAVYKSSSVDKAIATLSKAVSAYKESKTMDTDTLHFANLLEMISELHIQQRNYDKVEPLLSECLSIRQKKLGGGDADTIRTEHDLALIHYCSGKPEEAYQLYNECVPKLGKIMDVSTSRYADAIGRFARLHARKGQHQDAMKYLQQCITIRKKTEGPSELYLSDLHQLALANVAQKNFVGAIPILRNCLELRVKSLPARHPDIASTIASLGNALHKAENIDEAMEMYHQHLAMMEHAGRSEREFAHTLGSLALIYHKKGMFEEALNMYRRALEANAALGVFHPQYFEMTKHVSDFHTDSLSYFKSHVSRVKKSMGEAHPEYAFALGKLAFLHHLAGRLTDAENHYRKALPIIEKSEAYGDKHQTYAKLCGNFADVLVKSGRMKEALPLYDHCYKVFKEQHGEDHQNTVWYANLIRTLQKMIENAPTPQSPGGALSPQGTPNSKKEKKEKKSSKLSSPWKKKNKNPTEGQPPPHAPPEGGGGDYGGIGAKTAMSQQPVAPNLGAPMPAETTTTSQTY